MFRRPPTPTLFPDTTLFRSKKDVERLKHSYEKLRAAIAACSEEKLAANAVNRKFSNYVMQAFPLNTPQSQRAVRSEEHTSELQSHSDLVCRLLLEKKKRSQT